MKHLALRSKSVRSGDRPYTTPGLGDRVHSAMIAYQYGKAHNSPVTIHLTDDKWSVAGGKISGKKKKSWIEILSLFPSDTLYLMHPDSIYCPNARGICEFLYFIKILKIKFITVLLNNNKPTSHRGYITT